MKKIKLYTFCIFCTFFYGTIGNVLAENNYSSKVFIDTYSSFSNNSWDENPYFTQSRKQNNFNLNLAYAEFLYDKNSTYGKLSLQAGDSVDINYSAEPKQWSRFIQESYLGYKINKKTSIDVGSFLPHIGAESWLSKDNINYTRSFIAEFSPYYESGLRFSHQINKKFSTKLLLLNGWQNISENKHPALGNQFEYKNEDLVYTLNTFLGKENLGTRSLYDFILSKTFQSGMKVVASIDFGYQSKESLKSGSWWGYSLMLKKPISEKFSVNSRFEYYQDPHQVIVSSLNAHGFQSYGASVGLDFNLDENLLVRTELKQLFSDENMFISNSENKQDETLFVVSIGFLEDFLS